MWWLIVACNSGDERQAEFDAVGSQQIVPIEHPALELNTPSRTEFIAENDIALKGLLAEGGSPLSTLKVNGDEVSFAGNSFDTTVRGRPGVNILNLRLEAEDRGRAVDSVGVYVGPYLDKEAQVEAGGHRARIAGNVVLSATCSTQQGREEGEKQAEPAGQGRAKESAAEARAAYEEAREAQARKEGQSGQENRKDEAED